MMEEQELMPLITMEQYTKWAESREKARKLLVLVNSGLDYVNKRTPQLQENMAFYQNNLQLLKTYKENRPWVIQMNTPYATMAIDKRVASLIANDYVGELIAYSEKDVDTITTLMSLFKDEWERINMDSRIDEAIASSAVVREAYVLLHYDTSELYGNRKGEICASFLDTNSVLLDPKARHYRKALWVAVMGRMTVEEAKDTYPDFADTFSKSGAPNPQERGENYLENDYTNQQDGILTVYTIYRKEGKNKIMEYTLVDGLLVKEKHLSGLKRIPIGQMRWKSMAQSAYGGALMDDLLSLQKAIAAIESATTNTAVSYASPSIIVRKGSGLNPKVVAKTVGAPGVVYEVDMPIQESMQIMSPGKIDDKIVNLKTDFERAIDKIAGVTNQFEGDIGTAGNTSSGAKIAVERSKIVEANVIHNIAEFVEDLTLIMMDYLTALYAGEIVESRHTDESTGETKFIQRAVPESAKDVRFSYYINLNMKNSYSKDRERDTIKEIYQMERQYKAPVMLITELDILESYDLSNKDALRARYKQLQANSAENKAQVVAKITAAAAKFNIDPAMTQAALTDVIRGDENKMALDQFMQATQQMAQQMQGEMQGQADDLIAQGLDPESVQMAQQQMGQEGAEPTPQELGL